MMGLSGRQLRIMFNALISGDGHLVKNIKATSFRYTSKSKELANDVAEIALKLGYYSSINVCTKRNGKIYYRALIRSSRGNCINVERNFKKVHYEGDVVCFTVPNGSLITRRNNKILLSGNCDTEAMKGEIFQYDDCQRLEDDKYPSKDTLRVYMGVDLAISEDEKADKFAIVVIGIAQDRSAYYVLDFYENQLRFSAQTAKIIEYARRWDPIRIAIETNQYQEAQYQTLKDFEGESRGFDLRLKPVKTSKDKITRAWKLSSIFEDKKVYFRNARAYDLLVEHMVLFPNHRYKDLFDAFDLAVLASKLKKRRTREVEPGVI